MKHPSRFRALVPQLAWLILSGGFCVFPSLALAAWPIDPGSNLPVCTLDYDQEFPAILPDGAGGVFIAWQDYRSETEYHIYAQRISANGAPQWGANGIAVCPGPTGDQLVPHLASDGAGGVIVTWNDTRALLSDIYAQRLSPGGDLLWDMDGVPLCTAAGPQHDETVIPDGAGGAIVTWWDRRADGGFAIFGDIYAQRVNADGEVQWVADGVPICTASEDQSYPMIVKTDIGALIVWTDARSGSSNRNIYGRGITIGGDPLGALNGVVICDALGDQTSTALTTDGAGGAIVAWTDPRSGAPEKTYAQRLSNACASLWTANGVPVSSGGSAEFFPAIVSDGSGGAIFAWTDFRNYVTSGADVYAQKLSSTGARQWTASGVLLCNASDFQFFSTMTTDGAGGAIVTWQDQRNGAASTDVYARHVTAGGTAQWGVGSGGIPVSIASDVQQIPVIATDADSGAIVAWMDYREGTSDIYAQRIMSDGTLGSGTVSVTNGTPASIALAPVRNPVRGDRVQVRFSLATGEVGALELIDVAGRRIAMRELAGFGPGSHTLELGLDRHIPAGIYMIRLRQGGAERVTRVAVLK